MISLVNIVFLPLWNVFKCFLSHDVKWPRAKTGFNEHWIRCLIDSHSTFKVGKGWIFVTIVHVLSNFIICYEWTSWCEQQISWFSFVLLKNYLYNNHILKIFLLAPNHLWCLTSFFLCRYFGMLKDFYFFSSYFILTITIKATYYICILLKFVEAR